MSQNKKAFLKCIKCGAHKPPSDFRRDKRSSTGRKAWCKKCRYSYIPRKKQKRHICVICGSEFYTFRSNDKACSPKCRYRKKRLDVKLYYKSTHPKKTIFIKCEYCGDEFPAVSVKGTTLKKYCSPKCSIAALRQKRYPKRCIVCGKEFLAKTKGVEFCSTRCIGAHIGMLTKRRFASRPEHVKAKARANRKKHGLLGDRRARNQVTDRYVRQRLYGELNRPNKMIIAYKDITQDMVRLTRLKILAHRKA